MSELPRCVDCGTCCFSELPRYVRVRGDDHARLGSDAEALVVFHGNEAYMRMENGHCAALGLALGEGGAEHRCVVYERRPTTCRDLERGSPACAGEIAAKGDRPQKLVLASRLTSRR